MCNTLSSHNLLLHLCICDCWVGRGQNHPRKRPMYCTRSLHGWTCCRAIICLYSHLHQGMTYQACTFLLQSQSFPWAGWSALPWPGKHGLRDMSLAAETSLTEQDSRSGRRSAAHSIRMVGAVSDWVLCLFITLNGESSLSGWCLIDAH